MMASPSEHAKARRIAEAQRDFEAAYAHDQAGRRDRAEALYRKALQKAPDHADALHLLGVIAHERGRHARAIQLIERALAIVPEFPAAEVNLGNALKALGRRADAASSYRRAIALRPDYAIAYCNLGAVQCEQGAVDAALESAERAIALMPELADAHINRANALCAQRRFVEAEAALRRALELAPQRAETLGALGAVLAELGRLDDALSCHRRAIELRPDEAAPHHMTGSTLFRAHRLEASEASYRRALALAPELAMAWHGLGNVLVAQGRFDEATPCLRRALALDPDLAEAYEVLAFNRQRCDDRAELDHLGALLRNPDHPAADRIAAGFALGAFLDNANRCEDAFAYFLEANALCRQVLANSGDRFDARRFGQEVDGLVERCTPALFDAAAGFGNPSELPVFIVGMPRSGTSLVEQIAASHSRVLGAGERPDVARLAEAVRTHNRDRPIADWDMDFARQLADAQLAQLQTSAGGAVRVIDKTPDNILHLEIIALLFPGARVVFCRRDPRDTGLSCFLLRFGEGHAFACDLADCGHRLVETERLAEHWRRVLPLSMLTVDYEALIGDPEQQSRRLIEFLGLDWEPACLDFHRNRRPVFSASSWQVRQPIYHRSVGRWRRYEPHLGPLLAIVGRGGGAAVEAAS